MDIVSALSSPPPPRPTRTHKSLLSEYGYPVLCPLQEKPASLCNCTVLRKPCVTPRALLPGHLTVVMPAVVRLSGQACHPYSKVAMWMKLGSPDNCQSTWPVLSALAEGLLPPAPGYF